MEIYQLLVEAHASRMIIDDWLANDLDCDLRFRRARTKGHVGWKPAMCCLASACYKTHIARNAK